MRLSWPTVLVAALLVAAFLALFPAPAGCGCKSRKDRLRAFGGSVFGG